MKKLLIFCALIALAKSYGQEPLISSDKEDQKIWVNHLMETLTIDQKIGQLFMIQAYSNKDKKHTSYINKMIRKYHIGGLIFMQGTPERQVELTNVYQSKSKIPLLIGFDGEWGLDMRLKNSFRYPFLISI